MASAILHKYDDSTLNHDYMTLTKSVGLVDRSHMGRLSISGSDALDLLNRLSTNDLTTLAVGQMIPTVLTSNKGRILDLLYVLSLRDSLLVFTGSKNRQKVVEWLDFYTIMEDVSVKDTTNNTAVLSLIGPRALDLLIELTSGEVSSLNLYQATEASLGDSRVTIVRTDFVCLPGYDIVIDVNKAGQLADEITIQGENQKLRRVGHRALEIVRIERGIPSHGAEIAEDFNPLEAGLKKFVSFTKGCYVGQEVVARLNTYDKIQRRLVRLQWDSREPLPPGTSLSAQGKQVGVATSSVDVPWQEKGLGLGYVKKAYAQPGTILTRHDGGGEIEIAATPLMAN